MNTKQRQEHNVALSRAEALAGMLMVISGCRSHLFYKALSAILVSRCFKTIQPFHAANVYCSFDAVPHAAGMLPALSWGPLQCAAPLNCRP